MLRDSNPSFAVSSAILDSLVEEVSIIDFQGKILHVNAAWRAFAKLGGGAESDVAEGADYLGALRRAADGSLDASHILAGMESLLAGETDFFEYEYAYAFENEVRWFSQRVSPLRGASGAVVAYVDITDRKRAEQERESHRFELGRAVRAATLGQLSGALAHELNQPIAAILTNSQVGLAMNCGNPSVELFDLLADIERDARRAGALIERLRRMLQGRNSDFELINVNKVVEETLALCKSELIARRIGVLAELETGLSPLRGDQIALQHLLLNVIVNAYEAMSHPSTTDRTLKIATGTSNRASILVTVLDSGPGIDEAEMAKVFQPLYTTKDGGLGLGLSICRSIADTHRGDITVSRAASGGTLVTVELPIDSGDRSAQAS